MDEINSALLYLVQSSFATLLSRCNNQVVHVPQLIKVDSSWHLAIILMIVYLVSFRPGYSYGLILNVAKHRKHMISWTYLFIFYQHIESIITQLWILHNIKLLLLSSSRFYVGISLYFEFLFYLRFYSPPTFVVFTWWLLPWILKNTLHGFFSTRKENIHDLWLVFLNYAAIPLVMLIFEIWIWIVFSSIAGSLIWTSCLT